MQQISARPSEDGGFRPSPHSVVLHVVTFGSVWLSIIFARFRGITIDTDDQSILCFFIVLFLMLLMRLYFQVRASNLFGAAALIDVLWILFATQISFAILQYTMATFYATDVTQQIQKWDLIFGFDWYKIVSALQKYDNMIYYFHVAYVSFLEQMTFAAALFLVLKKYDNISCLLTHLILGALLTCFISGFISVEPPTLAVARLHGVNDIVISAKLDIIDQLRGLRDGSLRTVSAANLQGLVSFPSFHVQMAVYFAWAFRKVRWLAIPMLLLNILMIFGAITEGGHYLMDVLGGLAVAAVTIVLAAKAATLRLSFGRVWRAGFGVAAQARQQASTPQ